jgi:hypothetical protein
LLTLAATTVGCTTVRFRVTPGEVQRLAALPPAERTKEVRVVPWTPPSNDHRCVVSPVTIGGDGAIAAVMALAVLADMADEPAKERAEFASRFAGSISIHPGQVIHLQYDDGQLRAFPLVQLTPADAVGVLYAHVSEDDGRVTLWRRIGPIR